MLDRLLRHATTVATSGRSYRMLQARTRTGGRPTTSRTTARSGDFHLATSGDLRLATDRGHTPSAGLRGHVGDSRLPPRRLHPPGVRGRGTREAPSCSAPRIIGGLDNRTFSQYGDRTPYGTPTSVRMVTHAQRSAERTVGVLPRVVAYCRANPSPGARRQRGPDALVLGAVLSAFAVSGHHQRHGSRAGHAPPRPAGASAVPAGVVSPTVIDERHPDAHQDVRPHGEPRQSAWAARPSRMTKGDPSAPG